MNRRALLSTAAFAPVAGWVGARSAGAAAEEAAPSGWRRFEVTTRVVLLGSSGPARLWLPLAQSAGGYQAALDLSWRSSGRAELVRDDRYGAGVLRVEWTGAEAGQEIEAVQVVATRDRGAAPTQPLTEAERAFWTAATGSTPTDGIVRETAERITAGSTTPRERLRAIYDWVVDTTWRNPETPGCGSGDYKTMLESGKFGGKCADINGLFVGLARAAGFPARDVYGIRVADSRQFAPMGKNGDISKAQHCRCEAFLEQEGWFPVDPADVRKVVLEGKLPLESAEIRALRDRLFGSWEMNWVGYNSATDIALPGAANHQEPNFSFLMYPCAFTAAGQPDCLDPGRFRYEIRSRELPA